MTRLSRRDFLKLTTLVPATIALTNRVFKRLWPDVLGNEALPSVILLVFDAMSAKNLSLYGYPRKTTPNLERFAERATVYHSHRSAGNFTTPGTASLLTGMYPWSHKAINLGGLIARNIVEHNLFRLFGEEYHRSAFSQNIWADFLLSQFQTAIGNHLLPGSFGVVDELSVNNFRNDLNNAYRAFDDFLLQLRDPPGSLILGTANRMYLHLKVALAPGNGYPKGMPHVVNQPIYFRLEDIFKGLLSQITTSRPPYFSYFHVWPPHPPYNPNKKYWGIFLNDHWHPEPKPQHPLSDHISDKELNMRRRRYDEYIMNVDDVFGRFVDSLEELGVLDQSYLIVTADHGEMFERGTQGHITSLLYEPVVHIPLLISSPSQRSRKDVYSPTTSVDVMPTLLRLASREIPEWCEGRVLPGLGGEEEASRSMYVMEAKNSPNQSPLEQATIAMIKGRYKLIHYIGYREPGYADAYELYDLIEDSDELEDLYSSSYSTAEAMRAEMGKKLNQVKEQSSGR